MLVKTGRRNHRLRVSALMSVAATVAALALTIAPASATTHGHDAAFRQVNLVSDLPGVAPMLDKQVKNPWGIALGPHTPLWVSNNFNPALAGLCDTCIPTPEQLLTKITVYQGANGHQRFTKIKALQITASMPTGIVFNPTSSFVIRQHGVKAPANFLFNEIVVDAAGTAPLAEITGWSGATTPLPKRTVAGATKDGAQHTGLALVPGSHDSGPLLLAADAINGTIDVFNANFRRLNRPHAFVDPGAAELAPYNVTFLQGRVYVTYSSVDGTADALSVFTSDGRFLKRLATGAPLAGAWGMTIAPEHWGHFGGALLVGNVNDGMIHAFNPRTGTLLGTVSNAAGQPIVNPGLWGLAFGNGTIGTPRTLLFAAGIGSEAGGFGDDGYTHGLVGLIEPRD
jgi:uncharacterized protein (TIGR03118 family)